MHFIVLDTADARGSVAVFQSSQLQALEVHPSEEDYSSWLLPAVHRTLGAASLNLVDLDGYAVSAGPGSFTGLRVGLTTVKAWAEVYRKPVAALSRLEALARSEETPFASYIAACIDARRDQVFAALYAPGHNLGEPAIAECVTPLATFISTVEQQARGQLVRWITPDPHLLESASAWPLLKAAGHVLQVVHPPFASILATLAYEKFRQGRTADALTLDANYVRRSDAEILWKGNQSLKL